MDNPDDIPDWPKALSPVTAAQLVELRRFKSQVEKLTECSLFKAKKDTLTISYEDGGVVEMVHETEQEPVRAAAPIFRQLYTPNEHGSARRASNILKQSANARGGPDADKLIALMKHNEAALRILDKANGGFAINFNGEELHFKQIVDLLVNGEIMHSDVDKAAAFAALEGLVWFQFIGALVAFRDRYWLVRNCVTTALEHLE
jgi:hypothetical protein